MNLIFEQGTNTDTDELERLYNDINDRLACGTNYPGWRKGIYPVRRTAEDGIREKCLYIARINGKIAGSVILRHTPEPAYDQAEWQIDADYKDILVLYTFAVHPDFWGQGVGEEILNLIFISCAKWKIKAVRLDVYKGNMPAINLYKKCGFCYIDTVDLGLGEYGLRWFELYERVVYSTGYDPSQKS